MEVFRQISKSLENLRFTSRNVAGQVFIPFHRNRGSWRAGVNVEHQVHKSVHETVGGHFFYALRKEGVQGVPRNFFVLQPIPIPGYICEGLLDVWAV